MEVEDAQRCLAYRYIDVQDAAIAYLREKFLRHETHEEAGSQWEKRPIIGIVYLALVSDGMPGEDDVVGENRLRPEELLHIGAVGDMAGERLQSLEERFRHFLQAEDVEIAF